MRRWTSGDLGSLRKAIGAWIEEICAALAADPPQQLHEVVTEETDDGGFKSQREPELDLVAIAFASRDLGKEAPAFDDVVAAAVPHRDVFEQIPDLDAQGSAASRADQRTWVSSSVAEPILTSYIERAGGLRFDRSLFDEVFDQVERDLRAPASPYTLYAPLDQLDLEGDGPIEVLPGVTIRSATRADRERWLNRPFVGPREGMDMLDVRAVLETHFEEQKEWPGEAPRANEMQELVGRLCTSLQLNLNCDAHQSYVQLQRDAIFGTWLSGTVGPAPRGGRRRGRLTSAHRGDVRAIEAALRMSPNRAKCAIALRRWDDVCARPRPEDTIVDAWVGLESLLFSGKEGEITLRAAIRLAALIGRDEAERRALFTQVRRVAYDARSTVLHGADTIRLDLPVRAAEAREYLRRALLAVLQLPVPFDPGTIEGDLVAAGWSASR